MTRSVDRKMIRIEVLTPLSLGSGRERGALREVLRAPVITSRGLEYLPIIPSSSLKGALRAVAEALGKSLGKDAQGARMRIMAFHARKGGIIEHRGLDQSLIEEAKAELSDEERDLLERTPQEDGKIAYLCPICRLLGAPGIPSMVRFSDAIAKSYSVETITRTAIDRKRLKVRKEKLFTDEVISAGSEFRAIMISEVDPASPEGRLLSMVMRYATEVGIQLGGGRSVGRGRARIEEVRDDS